MHFKKQSLIVGVIAIITVALLLVVAANYFGGSTTSNNTKNLTTPVKVSNTSCGASNQTLCGEETTLERYIKRNDYSDILQNETPILVECNGSSSLQSYCDAGTSNVQIQLFKVVQKNQTIYKTRNQFIDWFMTYASQHGPFSYKGTTTSGNNAVMTFQNSAKNQTLTLTLSSSSTGWKVAYPSTGS